MNIAILNEVFLKQDHLQKLRQFGNVTVYEHTDTEEKVIERLRGIQIAIADCWEAPLTKNVFENIPDTKYLTIGSTGYELVDVKAANANHVVVSNIPGFSTDAVAEHTFALMLAVVRKLIKADKAVRQNPFQIDPAASEQYMFKGINLRDKTLGVVGLGQIGTRVAEIALGFGMHVIAYNRSIKQVKGVEQVSLETLLKTSDVVSLNTALGSDNKVLINRVSLKLMKPTSYLINTARGGLVNDDDLADALRAGTIAGAGLDVVANWSKDNPLLQLSNVVFSPHSAFFTDEALSNVANIIIDNVKAYVAGTPLAVVSD